MGNFKDLTGQKFGRLTVVGRAPNKGKQTMWLCRCTCGNETVVAGYTLTHGLTQSCGCLQREILRRFEDLTGQKFGKLTVLKRVANKGIKLRWLCRCDCGKTVEASGSNLKSGRTVSCGCTYKQQHHGMRKTRLYETWNMMKQRCFNPNNHCYSRYGGRGITVFPGWLNDFQAFYDYVSKLPHFGEEGYTLDRIDVNGNYEPDNVRWADAKTQSRNKRNNIIVEYQGVKMTLAEAAEKSGVQPTTLKRRLKHGETGEYLFRLPTVKNHK